MSLIRNKGFRVFLYILGYVSVSALIALSVVSAMRYSMFKNDIDTANAYAETENIRNSVRAELSVLQNLAQNKDALEKSGLENPKLDVVNYRTGEQKEMLLSELPESSYYSDVMTGLRNASYNWDYDFYGENAYPDLFSGSDSAQSSASVRFLMIGINDYLSLIKEHSYVYSSDLKERYFENPEQLSKELSSIYEKLITSGYTDYMDEEDYFLLLDDGVFVYSPGYQYIRKPGQSISLDAAWENQSTLFIALPEDLAVKKTFLSSLDDKTVRSILSGIIYTSGYDACYATLNEEQRSLVQTAADNSATILFANSAVNYEGDSLYISRLQNPNSFIETGDLSVYENSYAKLADALSEKADLYIRYDHKTGNLTQWYKDSAGTKTDFAYITDLQTLPALANGNFVMGVQLYESPMRALTFDELAFNISKSVPSPALFLVISAIVFLLCVILILVGEPAKLIKTDRIPFEIFLIGVLVVLFLFGFYLPRTIGDNVFTLIRKDIPALTGIALVIILVLYLATAGLFTTIARRIKCKSFLSSLLTLKLLKLIGSGAKRLKKTISRGWEHLSDSYEKSLNGHKRLIIFASVLFAVNALILLIFGMYHDEAVLLCFLLVLAEAFAGYQLIKYSAGVEKVLSVSRQIENGDLDAKTDPTELKFNVKELGESLNRVGDGLSKAIESSIRDERTKAELITNVSHDIKTPLTSIISYVDLLKNEPIENERAKEYIEVLDKKSQRLKQLIMDLIEVSKTNTGNIELERTNLNLTELLDQILGEYEEKMAASSLEVVKNISAENTVIYADGRRIFRIIDNVLNNVVKYTQPGTRVYIDLANSINSSADGAAAPAGNPEKGSSLSGNARKTVVLSVKNVSREMLNISAEELTERFVRGDRSRHTEGSGLGLSIAKNLTELQDGTFRIEIDGDLFKVEIAFPAVS